MKQLICFAIIVLTSSYCFAQPEHQSCLGEIVFYTPQNQPLPAGVNIYISSELTGIVFDHNAAWNDQVIPVINTPEYLYTNNSNLDGSTNMLSYTKDVICWESESPNDSPASSDICTGMVGWGVYTFTVSCGIAEPIVFTVNLVDGNWMHMGQNEDDVVNKIIFRVIYDNGVIDLQRYDWAIPSWTSITTNMSTAITFWNCYQPRERRGLPAGSSWTPFNVSKAVPYPLFTNSALIDVPIEFHESMYIDYDKNISITDFYDNCTGLYNNTELVFDRHTGITLLCQEPNAVYGTSLQVQGHQIPNSSDNSHTVKMGFSSVPNFPYDVWDGIGATWFKPASSLRYNIHISNCDFKNMGGVSADNYLPTDAPERFEVDHCKFEDGLLALRTDNAIVNFHHNKISNCGVGIAVQGYSFNMNHSNTINDCVIEDCVLNAIMIEDLGTGRPYSLLTNSSILKVHDNMLLNSGRDGIVVWNSVALIYNNDIGSNGWDESGWRGSGINAMMSDLNFHENTVFYNDAYGIKLDHSSAIRGNYIDYSTDDRCFGNMGTENPLLKGRNCFYHNGINIGCSNLINGVPSQLNSAMVIMGVSVGLSFPGIIDYIADENALLDPVTIINGSTEPCQMAAEGGGMI